jgi:hypothetical protein
MEQLFEEENCAIFELFMYYVELEKKKVLFELLHCFMSFIVKKMVEKESGLCVYKEHYSKERIEKRERKNRNEEEKKTYTPTPV